MFYSHLECIMSAFEEYASHEHYARQEYNGIKPVRLYRKENQIFLHGLILLKRIDTTKPSFQKHIEMIFWGTLVWALLKRDKRQGLLNSTHRASLLNIEKEIYLEDEDKDWLARAAFPDPNLSRKRMVLIALFGKAVLNGDAPIPEFILKSYFPSLASYIEYGAELIRANTVNFCLKTLPKELSNIITEYHNPRIERDNQWSGKILSYKFFKFSEQLTTFREENPAVKAVDPVYLLFLIVVIAIATMLFDRENKKGFISGIFGVMLLKHYFETEAHNRDRDRYTALITPFRNKLTSKEALELQELRKKVMPSQVLKEEAAKTRNEFLINLSSLISPCELYFLDTISLQIIITQEKMGFFSKTERDRQRRALLRPYISSSTTSRVSI